MIKFLTAAALLVALPVGGTAYAQETLSNIRSKGTVKCGVNPGLPGFAAPDDKGVWKGFDVDFCRAVAAAVFSDPNKVTFAPLTSKERFTAVQSGEVDLLARNTSWTFSRETLGLTFVGVNFYDGQGFMIRKELGVTHAKELDKASICTSPGSTIQLNVADYFQSNGMTFQPVVLDTPAQEAKAFETGRCDVLATDRSGLAAQRLALANPDDFIILPETISKEPLSPAVRQNDRQWADIVRWTLNVLILAEEMGVTSENIDQVKNQTQSPEIKRLLGSDGDYSTYLGLGKDWTYNVIKAVGNYSQVYERNLGQGSPLKMDRGQNRLWKDGGLLYATPMR